MPEDKANGKTKEKVELTPEEKEAKRAEEREARFQMFLMALDQDKKGNTAQVQNILKFTKGRIPHDFAQNKVDLKLLTQKQYDKLKEWDLIGAERKEAGESQPAVPWRWKWWKKEYVPEKSRLEQVLIKLSEEIDAFYKNNEKDLEYLFEQAKPFNGDRGKIFSTYFANEVIKTEEEETEEDGK